jgi:hypothetical protein
VASPAAATDSTGLAALLDAHAEALGGRPAIAALDRLELEGEVEAAGQSGTFRLIASRPAHRLDLDLGPLTESHGYDGERAWVHDRNGVTRPIHLSERDEVILRGLLLTYAYLIGDEPSGSGEPPGSTVRSELELRRLPSTDEHDLLELALGGASELTLFLNRRSHLIVESSWTQGANRFRSTYSDYRPVGPAPGVLIPHRIDRTVPGGLNEQFRVIGATARPRSADSRGVDPELAAPPSRRNVTFTREGGATVPIRTIGHHVFAEARINGRDAGLFFLDTGAGANCVNEATAEEFGLEAVGEVAATGIGGVATTRFRRIESLAVGSLELGKHIAVSLDLGPIEEALGIKIGGILGYDLWSQVVFSIDYRVGQLTLRDWPSAAAEATDLGREIELRLAQNVPLLRGTVEDRFEGWFRLDSGSGSMVDLHAPFVEQHDLVAERETRRAWPMGVGGAQEHLIGTLSAFTLAGERFTDVEAGFSLATDGAFFDEDTAGNIGGQLLRQFAITFDYSGERAFLKRLPDALR